MRWKEQAMRVAFAAVLVTAVVSCGGGKGSGPATGDTGGGGSGGTTGSGGSSGGASGTASGGSGSGGGGGTTSGGTGVTGGGSAGSSGGSSGGSGGSGSGGGGSGVPAGCAGLVPTLDSGRTVRVDDTPAAPYSASCWRGMTAPDGELALGVLETQYRGTIALFSLWASDGSSQQGSLGYLDFTTRSDVDPWLHTTSAGWAGLRGGTLRAFDKRGNVLASSRDSVDASAPDGHGGSVALARSVTTTSSGGVSYGPEKLEWLDGSSQVVRTAALDDYPKMLLVSWGTGHVLVIAPYADGVRQLGPRARWYDGAGVPLTPWFDAPGVEPFFASMHLLVDGSVALSDGQVWRGVFRDGVASVDAPPDWLAARPGTRLATIRNGTGYAVLPFAIGAGATGGDETSLEVVTPSGESCGTMKIPAAADGLARTPVSIEVGQDGTVVQTESLGSGDRSAHCEFRFWPALLR